MPNGNRFEEEIFLEKGPQEEQEVFLERTSKIPVDEGPDIPRQVQDPFARVLKVMGYSAAKAIESKIRQYGGGARDYEPLKDWQKDIFMRQGYSPQRIQEVEESLKQMAEEVKEYSPTRRYQKLIGATEEELEPQTFWEDWSARGIRTIVDIVTDPAGGFLKETLPGKEGLKQAFEYMTTIPTKLLGVKAASTLAGSAAARATNREWVGDVTELMTDLGLTMKFNRVNQKTARYMEKKLRDVENDTWGNIEKAIKNERVPSGDYKSKIGKIRQESFETPGQSKDIEKFLEDLDKIGGPSVKAERFPTETRFKKEVDPLTREAKEIQVPQIGMRPEPIKDESGVIRGYRAAPTYTPEPIFEEQATMNVKPLINGIKKANKKIFSPKVDSVEKDFYVQAKAVLMEQLEPLLTAKPWLRDELELAKDVGYGLRNLSESTKALKALEKIPQDSQTKHFMDYVAAHAIIQGNIPAGLTATGANQLRKKAENWMKLDSISRQRVEDLLANSAKARQLFDDMFKAIREANPRLAQQAARDIDALMQSTMKK